MRISKSLSNQLILKQRAAVKASTDDGSKLSLQMECAI